MGGSSGAEVGQRVEVAVDDRDVPEQLRTSRQEIVATVT
jgi:hypothetical protein